MNLLKNWKTTLAGLGTLLVVVGHIMTSASHGAGISAGDLSALVLGIGAIFAKDA